MLRSRSSAYWWTAGSRCVGVELRVPNVLGIRACQSGSGAKTTYEGGDGESWLRLRCPVANRGFQRATFVKCRATPSNLGPEAHQEGRMDAVEVEHKYEIGEELGTGATAKVYRAVKKRTGQEVAIKAICKERMLDKDMFLNEIDIHKATDHPNILRLLETFEDDKYIYLVAELCAGGDLRQYLDAISTDFGAASVEEKDALHLIRQVVNSVRYLHVNDIVHRDLKPGNFLCVANSTCGRDRKNMIVKLADFGISAACPKNHRLTRRVGTDGFMAPEIISCQPYDEKADIFSVGCILHRLLTGHPPKYIEKSGTYKLSIRMRFPSPEARELVELLTQHRPEDRPSAHEVLQLPLLNCSRAPLQETGVRLDSQLLDQMYAYSSFPLLKKAALVAMVSSAESDDDFVPSIEKFMSLNGANASGGVGVDDIYRALREELLSDMDRHVEHTLRDDGRAAIGCEGGCPAPHRTPPFTRLRSRRSRGRRRQNGCDAVAERFCAELRSDLESLVHRIDGSGIVSYSEWLAATADTAWFTDSSRIAGAFKLFDHDQDGFISAGDLKEVLPGVFSKLPMDAVLQESQLSAARNSWITEHHFALLMRTHNPSVFTLQRIADGVKAPLSASRDASDFEVSATSMDNYYVDMWKIKFP